MCYDIRRSIYNKTKGYGRKLTTLDANVYDQNNSLMGYRIKFINNYLIDHVAKLLSYCYN